MTGHIIENKLQLVATEALNADGHLHKAVTINGTIAATPRTAVGLLKTLVNSGNHAPACYQGVTKGIVGAAVTTPGWPLTITTSGFLIAAASGNVSIGRYIGTGAAASGDMVALMADFTNFGYNPG
jgi:hypothetical protein